jgi:CRP-like cAMP-binding protein
MIELHLMKLRARDDISAEEEEVIRGGVQRLLKVEADRVAVREGELMDHSMILLSGLAARRKDMADGRRQFTALHVPGDFTDLHSFTLKYLDHDVVALTNCTFAIVPHAHLKMMTERYHHLTRVYWFGTNLDAAINREWVFSLGSRDAIARMAHLFCELQVRMALVGLDRNGSYDLPITQQELGEILGITPVHVNRTLQQLRSDGLLEFARGMVTINDLDALRRIGEFDPTYLYLDRRPR